MTLTQFMQALDLAAQRGLGSQLTVYLDTGYQFDAYFVAPMREAGMAYFSSEPPQQPAQQPGPPIDPPGLGDPTATYTCVPFEMIAAISVKP